jgi:hypothetical protein
MTTTTPQSPAEDTDDRVVDALVSVIQAAAGPAAQDAQTLLLRRLATEGDVIPSRVPAPLNITEVGGYLNQLELLGQRHIALQVLTSALGIAGQPSALLAKEPAPLSFASVPNDRPAGQAAPTAPAIVLVRSDLVASVQAVLGAVHKVGAALPLWTPAAPSALLSSTDPMEVCGRVLRVLPTATLSDPATDSVVLGRDSATAANGYSLFARPDPANAAAQALPQLHIFAVGLPIAGPPNEVDLGAVRLLPLDSVLSAAGWLATPAPTMPASRSDISWARLVNVSGLLPGVTQLGEELRLVWDTSALDDTPFAAKLDWVWDGSDFVAPGG